MQTGAAFLQSKKVRCPGIKQWRQNVSCSLAVMKKTAGVKLLKCVEHFLDAKQISLVLSLLMIAIVSIFKAVSFSYLGALRKIAISQILSSVSSVTWMVQMVASDSRQRGIDKSKSLSTHLKCIEMQNYYVENNLKSKSDADETIHTMELGIKVIQNTLRNENDKKTNLLNSLK